MLTKLRDWLTAPVLLEFRLRDARLQQIADELDATYRKLRALEMRLKGGLDARLEVKNGTPAKSSYNPALDDAVLQRKGF